jgi:DNA modification methylase
MGDLARLADSIETYKDVLPNTGGLIHPILLDPNNVLIAGGRRTEAHRILKREFIAAVYSNEIDEATLRELELEENVERMNMSWKEEVLSVMEVHKIRERQAANQNEKWNQSKTGALLSLSQAHISNLLVVGEKLKTDDLEIHQCKNLSDALGVLLHRKEQEASKKLVGNIGIASAMSMKELSSTSLGSIDIIDLDLGLDDSNSTIPKPKAPVPVNITGMVFDLAKLFIHGDCIDVMSKMEPASFDHIVTDIPYGIDMNNLDTFNDIASVADEHDVAENVELMSKFIPEAFRVLKPSGYLVFWYDLDHHEKLIALGKQAGFKVQRWPIVWCKTHSCRNSQAQYNITKATEVAMVMRKSAEATLVKPIMLNFFLADGSVERRLYDNPFSKPADAWNFILNAIAISGQKILDPFAGEMSCPRACINNGLDFTAIELKEQHLVKGINAIKELLTEMTNGEAEFRNNYTKN